MATWYNNSINEKYIKDDQLIPDGYVKGRLKRNGLRQQYLNELLLNLDKDKFISFYSNHTANDTYIEFKFKDIWTVYDLSKLYEYKKPKATTPKNHRSHESYVNGGKKSAVTQKQNWNNKSLEEKQQWSTKMSMCHLNESFHSKVAINNFNYRTSLSQEENDKQNKQRSETMKLWWSKLSEEERQTLINNHFNHGAGYKSCDSKPNLNFAKLLSDNSIVFEREKRLSNFSFDFKVNDVLIEINPTVTHNSTWSPFGNPLAKDYHYNKSNVARESGYKCIHVFDWDSYDKIINLLKNRTTIYARNCDIKHVSTNDSKQFINQHHLQNYVKSTIQYGLYYKDELVSIMTFDKPRYNKKYEYELVRYCSSYNVIGGPEKLFKHFIIDYNPSSIISYCDASKFSGKLYNQLGFILINNNVKPSKHWYNVKTHQHITDNLLRQRGYDQLFKTNYGKGTSNQQLMIDHGFVEIYDCGQLSFEYINQ